MGPIPARGGRSAPNCACHCTYLSTELSPSRIAPLAGVTVGGTGGYQLLALIGGQRAERGAPA